jgi:hypothetical protein
LIDFFSKVGWYPTIGDPSFMGWFTVLAYLVAAIISARVCYKGKRLFIRVPEKQKRLWLAISITMFLLCINKQLDLQTFFTATARYYFLEYGIYEYRRQYQEIFILVIAIAGVLVAVGLSFEYRKVIKNHLLAIVGLVFLISFILIRASSFHNMDRLISSDILGFKMDWVLELTGIFLISINAVKLLRRKVVIRKRVSKKQQ